MQHDPQKCIETNKTLESMKENVAVTLKLNCVDTLFTTKEISRRWSLYFCSGGKRAGLDLPKKNERKAILNVCKVLDTNGYLCGNENSQIKLSPAR